MADRNPFIPAERRQDVEHKETDNEDAANRQFAEKQAEIARNKGTSKRPHADSGADKQQTLKN
jgi:hypothetical protein